MNLTYTSPSHTVENHLLRCSDFMPQLNVIALSDFNTAFVMSSSSVDRRRIDTKYIMVSPGSELTQRSTRQPRMLDGLCALDESSSNVLRLRESLLPSSARFGSDLVQDVLHRSAVHRLVSV
jgi:hypothetical protein